MPSPNDLIRQYREQIAQIEAQKRANITGGSYFTNNDTFRNTFDSGNWQDAMRQLGFINLDNIANMNSPLYKQYTGLLQRTMPGMGANTLLSGLTAGGAGYAGGKAIANAQLKEFNKQRQDGINSGLLGFATNMQQQIMPQIQQIASGFTTQQDYNLRKDQADAASSPWGMIGGAVGGLLGGALMPGLQGVFSNMFGGTPRPGSGGGTGGGSYDYNY